jgi:hypothetical protein
MRRRSPRRIKREAAGKHYQDWLHSRPCVGHRTIPGHRCAGVVTSSHERNPYVDGVKQLTGMGRKESIFRQIPMCFGLHLGQWEQKAGFFHGRTDQWRHDWFTEQLFEEHAAYDVEFPGRLAL